MKKGVELANAVFGRACNIAELSRLTKIPASTLRQWKDKPGRISLVGFVAIMHALGKTPQEVAAVIERIG